MKLRKVMAGTMVATLLMSQSIFAGTTLAVNGDYELKSAPDAADISFDISASGKTAKESSDAANASLKKIIDKLVASSYGIKKEDIKITYQSTYEEYDYIPVETTEEAAVDDYYYYPEEVYDVVGYNTNYTVRVNVGNINNADEVNDLILAGGDDISYTYVNYKLTNDDDVYYTALEKAVEVALEKAEKMSKTFFNGKKYKIQAINETGYNYSYSDYYGGMIESSKSLDITPYLPEVTTTGSVNVVVEFED